MKIIMCHHDISGNELLYLPITKQYVVFNMMYFLVILEIVIICRSHIGVFVGQIYRQITIINISFRVYVQMVSKM